MIAMILTLIHRLQKNRKNEQAKFKNNNNNDKDDSADSLLVTQEQTAHLIELTVQHTPLNQPIHNARTALLQTLLRLT